jgi:hypothetical protein
MNASRSLTNFQVRKRLYAYEGKPLRATLRTLSGQVEVGLPKQAVIDVLSSLDIYDPCPCRFVVRDGQGYLFAIAEASR